MGKNWKIKLDIDIRLMLLIARGDKAAFSRLYTKYFPILIHYIAKIDGQYTGAEDLAQETFVRIWLNKAKYQPNGAVKTYLLSYAKNVLREKHNQLTKISNLNSHLRENSLLPANLSDELESDCYRVESLDVLNYAMSKLSTAQREAVILFYTEKKSLSEAAKHCNCSTKAFESRLIRARNKLRILLSSVRH